MAVAQAGLIAAPAHYSPAAAVSSQSIVRHDEQARLVAPVAKLAVAAPAQIAYHAAPAPIAYHAPIAKVLARQPEEIVSRHIQKLHLIIIKKRYKFHQCIKTSP